jgi:hypothetical protein
MKLPHSKVEVENPTIEKFSSAEFTSTNFARMSIVRLNSHEVQLNTQRCSWNKVSLEELAEFCMELAEQLYCENPE